LRLSLPRRVLLPAKRPFDGFCSGKALQFQCAGGPCGPWPGFFGAQCFGVKFTVRFRIVPAPDTPPQDFPPARNRERCRKGAFRAGSRPFSSNLPAARKRRFAQLRDSGFEGGLVMWARTGSVSGGQPFHPVLHGPGHRRQRTEAVEKVLRGDFAHFPARAGSGSTSFIAAASERQRPYRYNADRGRHPHPTREAPRSLVLP